MKPTNNDRSQTGHEPISITHRSNTHRAGTPRAVQCMPYVFVVTALVVYPSGCDRQRASTAGSMSKTNADASEVTIDVDNLDKAKPPILIKVSITPEARVKATAEEITMELHQDAWQEFSIEIENGAGITSPLAIESEQIVSGPEDRSRDRWLLLELAPEGPLTGSRLETRTLRIKSRDSGIRTAILNFNAGQGTQDLGFRSDVLMTFKVHPR